MKSTRIRLYLLFISLILSSININAFEVDGIKYFISSTAADEVGVDGYSGNNSEVTIPEIVEFDGITYTVTFIRPNAFSYCEKLNTVGIPSSVTHIYGYAFQGCTNLKNITIPNSVVLIGDWSFNGCKSLTSITIPQSVASIGYNAFYECKNLELVKFENNNPSEIYIDRDAFAGISSSAIAVVPQGTTKEYMRISNWWNSFDLIKQDGLVSMTIMAYNGYVTYNNQIITSSYGESFSIEEGSSVTIYLTPNDGYKILYVKHNDIDVTSSVK